MSILTSKVYLVNLRRINSMDEWVDKECATCRFVPDGFKLVMKEGWVAYHTGICRKNPPSWWHADDKSGIAAMMYSEVLSSTPACSYWKSN